MPTVKSIRNDAKEGPITMLTAYDAPTAAIIEAAGVDIALVGDSIGNAVLGYETTLPVTMDEIASATGAVARSTEDTLVVADLPFLSVGVSRTESIQNAGRLIKEAGAEAVKIEAGSHTVELTERLTSLGIPVMAHLGLTPQRVHEYGGYTQQATTEESAQRILELARDHEEAGAFAVVLEHVPSNVAAEVTEALAVPTIGIGAGPSCDGQVLVVTDAVGLSDWTPPFVREFGDLRSAMREAIDAYVEAVESGEFPGEDHSEYAEDLDSFG